MSEILPLVLKSDRKAQYEFYTLLVPRLKGVSLRYLKSKEEIEDILQETFLSIFSSIATFKGESKVETWATRILINNILQKFNRDKKYTFSDVGDEVIEDKGNFSVTDGNLLHEELIQLVNKLSDSKKIIFNLYVIEGYSHKEIGELLNITESTSKTQLFRAKETLVELHKKMNHVRTIA